MLALAFALLLPQQDNGPHFLFIKNKYLRVGVELDAGAAISWISEASSERNLVNDYDHGRFIQQSYYGGPDGTFWNDKPWVWNPVQGGDYKGGTVEPLEIQDEKTKMYARSYARSWSGCTLMPDVVLEEWISLDGELIHARYKVSYLGNAPNPAHDQEVPAVFLQPAYDLLVTYDGNKPWSADAVRKTVPGWPNEFENMTEHWAAYLDPTDFGLGVYVPTANRLTCYRFGKQESDQDACSYFAPLVNLAILPKKSYQYDAYITVGSSESIRKRFYKLAGKKWAVSSTRAR